MTLRLPACSMARVQEAFAMFARFGIALLIAGVVASASLASYQIGQIATARVADSVEARNQKILDVIVRRNPQASVRDFQHFPALLVRESNALGLDFRYVMALIDAESEWKPDAVSPKCAIGLMQVMPGTADDVYARSKDLPGGFSGPVKAKARCYDNLNSLGDPLWNVRIGMRYLRMQIDEYGFGPEHLRAYNRGPGKALAHWPNDRYPETVALKFVALAGVIR